MEDGNFLKAWGGISSLQVSLLSSCCNHAHFEQNQNANSLCFLSNHVFLTLYIHFQFVLPVTWSYGKKHGITLNQLASWWSEKPAMLAGQKNKVTNNIVAVLLS